MSVLIDPSAVEAAAHSLIGARSTSAGIEVSTPVVYPDGQAVNVLVTVQEGEYVIHDAGAGAMYLTAAGVRLTAQLSHRLAALASNYGCEFIEGRMTRRCSPEQVAVAIAMVANASRSVGDQTLERRQPVERDFREIVSERLEMAVGKRLRRREEVKGRSGHPYQVANVVLDYYGNAPIAFVESIGSRGTIAEHYMKFDDLRPAHQGVRHVAVYDDNEQFRAYDLALMRDVADSVLRYGMADRLIAELKH